MTFDIEKIKTKIKAALALADDKGASEGEAVNAMNMAIMLAEKHGLSLEDIRDGKLKRSDYVSQSFETSETIHEIDLYLSKALEQFCSVLIYRDHVDGDIKYFGHIADIELARFIRDMMHKVSEYEFDLYKAAFSHLKIKTDTLRDDFFLGFAERMKERMKTIKEDATKATEQSTALVVIKNQLVQAAFDDEQGKKLELGETVDVEVNAHPHDAGRNAANKVKLNQSVETKKQRRIK